MNKIPIIFNCCPLKLFLIYIHLFKMSFEMPYKISYPTQLVSEDVLCKMPFSSNLEIILFENKIHMILDHHNNTQYLAIDPKDVQFESQRIITPIKEFKERRVPQLVPPPGWDDDWFTLDDDCSDEDLQLLLQFQKTLYEERRFMPAPLHNNRFAGFSFVLHNVQYTINKRLTYNMIEELRTLCDALYLPYTKEMSKNELICVILENPGNKINLYM